MPIRVLVIQQQYVRNIIYPGSYEYQLVLFLTFPYYGKTPKILRKDNIMFRYVVDVVSAIEKSV